MKIIRTRDYKIFVGDFWEALDEFLKVAKYSKIIILIDENTRRQCLPIFLSKIKMENAVLIEIPSGEMHKNIETCQTIWRQMIENQIGRNALMINLGGGVIGDMGGFCASTFKRGINFIQIPTTLLSQVDASIGGKLGIDFGRVKNSVGLFKNPKAVFINSDFLNTLPKREIRSGFAEMIKHALIADVAVWEELKKIEELGKINWLQHIIFSLKIKKQIVEADPFEKNDRKKLNFGHTIGHAIESLALEIKHTLLHGEAIAAGVVCESWLSMKKADLSKASLIEISDCILKIYGKVEIEESSFSNLLTLMKNDKKNEGTGINFTLLSKPGESLVNNICSEDLVIESLRYYMNL